MRLLKYTLLAFFYTTCFVEVSRSIDINNSNLLILEKKANQGDIKDQKYLGSLYRYGATDISKNLSQAIKWYTKAANQGDIDASFKLGNIYFDIKNYGEAIRWYTKAANKGDALSQNNLGNIYMYGYGTHKNLNAAKNYYKLSCSQGLKWPCESLSLIKKIENKN